MNVVFTKTMAGAVPADPTTVKFYNKLKLGQNFHGDLKGMRNGGFHRKYFALLNLAFEYWEPGEINTKYGVPEKNFDQFREDCTIKAGYYIMNFRLDGSYRPKAKSISWAKMDQEEFEKLYSATLDVLLKYVPVIKTMEDEIDELTDKILEFA